jgi:glycerol uptake facilitator-like aquaporin
MVSGKQSPLSQRPEAVPYAVGLYITAAYWFTASTSFANPAVTIARSLSDTFAGIAPGGVAAFVVAQLAGMLVAVGLSRRLWRKPNDRLGSSATDAAEATRPCTSASPRKRTNSRPLGYVRFVP